MFDQVLIEWHFAWTIQDTVIPKIVITMKARTSNSVNDMKHGYIALVLILAGCSTPEPPVIESASVQLNFENNLVNLGSATVRDQAHDGSAEFAESKTGDALFCPGDGRWIEFETKDKILFDSTGEISFDFRRDDWINPYKKGSATQTAVVVSSRTPERIWHISFNIANGPKPILSVAFKDAQGQTHRLHSKNGLEATQWHHVGLRFQDGKSQLYVNGNLDASEKAEPAVLLNGIDRIKVGTWHKQNQAYRGSIDNLVIREMP